MSFLLLALFSVFSGSQVFAVETGLSAGEPPRNNNWQIRPRVSPDLAAQAIIQAIRNPSSHVLMGFSNTTSANLGALPVCANAVACLQMQPIAPVIPEAQRDFYDVLVRLQSAKAPEDIELFVAKVTEFTKPLLTRADRTSEEVQELLQEAVLIALEALPTFRSTLEPGVWLAHHLSVRGLLREPSVAPTSLTDLSEALRKWVIHEADKWIASPRLYPEHAGKLIGARVREFAGGTSQGQFNVQSPNWRYVVTFLNHERDHLFKQLPWMQTLQGPRETILDAFVLLLDREIVAKVEALPPNTKLALQSFIGDQEGLTLLHIVRVIETMPSPHKELLLLGQVKNTRDASFHIPPRRSINSSRRAARIKLKEGLLHHYGYLIQ